MFSCEVWAVWVGRVMVRGGHWLTSYPGSSLPSTKACAGWEGGVCLLLYGACIHGVSSLLQQLCSSVSHSCLQRCGLGKVGLPTDKRNLELCEECSSTRCEQG